MKPRSIFSLSALGLLLSLVALLDLPQKTEAAYVEKFSTNQFCQFDSECKSGCCTGKRCQDYNSCPILKQIERYENKNYCRLDSECTSGLCCFDQKCMPYMNCFIWIYFPIIGSAVVAVLFSYIATFFIHKAIALQDQRVRAEIREPWEQKRERIFEAKREVKDQEKKE